MQDVLTQESVTEASPPRILVQSVLYRLPVENIERALEFLDNAARCLLREDSSASVGVSYGDCSPTPTLDGETLAVWRRRYPHLHDITYSFFNANLGSAAGHNRLLGAGKSDLVMILNPDVLVSPDLFVELLSALARPGAGFVEARQLPIEHPKDYDPKTGETSWASTACAMASRELFAELRGFDAETFFLYCDDVDFSWRVRLAGRKVIHQRSAVVFHDKRINNLGQWVAGEAEKYFSAEAGLLLPYKYSRPDITENLLAYFKASDDVHLQKAATAFEERRASGRLPAQIDQRHRVAQFVDGGYAPHRY